MAMALDRSTEAIADRTDPVRRHLDETTKRNLRIRTVVIATAAVIGIALAKVLDVAATYPDEAGSPPRTVTLEEWLLAKIQVVLDYVRRPDDVGLLGHRADRHRSSSRSSCCRSSSSSSRHPGSPPSPA